MRLLDSPRMRRRLGTGVVVVVALATAAGVVAVVQRAEAPEPLAASPAAGPAADEYVTPEREIRLTRAMRRQIDATLDRFVPAAVARKDPALAWELAGPGLRGATTKRDWLRGELPVFPFPARGGTFHGWRAEFAYRNQVALELLLHARPETKRGAMYVSVDVVRRGGKWVVDAWYPSAVFSDPQERPWVTGVVDFTPTYMSANNYYEQAKRDRRATLSAAWIAVPVVILCGALLVPAGLGVVAIRRRRRAAAAVRPQNGRTAHRSG